MSKLKKNWHFAADKHGFMVARLENFRKITYDSEPNVRAEAKTRYRALIQCPTMRKCQFHANICISSPTNTASWLRDLIFLKDVVVVGRQ